MGNYNRWNRPAYMQWYPCYSPVWPGASGSTNNAQFVSNISLIPGVDGQPINGLWSNGTAQPINFGTTAVLNGNNISLVGNNAISLAPGRYQVSYHAVLADFVNYTPLTPDTVVTRLVLDGNPLDYTENSAAIGAQATFVDGVQINKTSIIEVDGFNSILQWYAGTNYINFDFSVFEASVTIVQL